MATKIIAEYTNSDGQLVTVYRPRAPRQGERTWRSFSKYSIFQMGAQGAALGNRCAITTTDRIGRVSL
jgi:hypothetical protein